MRADPTPTTRQWLELLGLLALSFGCGEPVAVADMALPDAGAPEVRHLATNATLSPSGELTVARPESAEGDLLVLFLSRTDDPLPLRLEGWTAQAACLTSFNTQLECLTRADCTAMDGDYCTAFGEMGTGEDLATVVYTRSVAADEPTSYGWTLRGTEASWAALSAVRGADGAAPIRDRAVRSFDAVSASVFPSAHAEAGDLLLLFQAFDDPAAEGDFLAPAGMMQLAFVAGFDEAGHLFAGPIAEGGPTGERETLGAGGPDAKDLMVTVVVAAP